MTARLALLATALFGASAAQAPTASKSPGTQTRTTVAAATKKYCQPQTRGAASAYEGAKPDNRFCFAYPASWQILGDAYVNGVILAPQQKLDRQLWDAVTVAAIVLPPEPNHLATSINDVIETAMAGLRESGRNPETLQRQQRTVDGKPAQMIKVRYHDQETARDWVEELVFIEGPEQEIYSVALKCAPEHLKSMEPSLAAILRSWKLKEATVPSDATEPAQPGKQSGPPQPK
jgi:hypothetical protein